MTRKHPRRVAAALASALVLVGCAGTGQEFTTGGASSAGKPGKASAAPYTPSGPATQMPAGAYDKVSKGGPTLAPTASGPLLGKTVVIDPGHNGGFNPGVLNAKVATPFGPFQCMATGSQSDGATPLTEHELNWTVANLLATTLREQGARVILTRPDDNGLGPCNIDRAGIANAVKADLYLSVHADGQAMGRSGIADPQGFHTQVDTAMLGGPTLVARSLADAQVVVDKMRTFTHEPLSNYVVRQPEGVWQRSKDLMVLAGLKDTPGVLIEMGNLKNAANLARLKDPAVQQSIADALAAAASDVILNPPAIPASTATSSSPSPGAKSAKPSASPSKR